ncbi:MAG: hypothetical protein KF767_12680 [Bdellovibrionaceae bacterium]|nr:hypothetical protein [Pseudobdellovibrionaceae bacterium]
MRMMKSFFLPLCFGVLFLVIGATSFAGNGVERGSTMIEWDDVAGLLRPEMREAIEESIRVECPQLSDYLRGDTLVVHAMRVVGAGAQINEPQGAPVMELTFRLASNGERRFKVRMAAEPPRGFLATDREAPGVRFKVTILEWIGTKECFGMEFGTPNERR